MAADGTCRRNGMRGDGDSVRYSGGQQLPEPDLAIVITREPDAKASIRPRRICNDAHVRRRDTLEPPLRYAEAAATPSCSGISHLPSCIFMCFLCPPIHISSLVREASLPSSLTLLQPLSTMTSSTEPPMGAYPRVLMNKACPAGQWP